MNPGPVTDAEFAQGWVNHLKESWFEYSTNIGGTRRITPQKFLEFVIADGLEDDLPVWQPIIDRYGNLDATEFIRLLRDNAAPNRPVAQGSSASPVPGGGKRRRKTRRGRKSRKSRKRRKTRK